MQRVAFLFGHAAPDTLAIPCFQGGVQAGLADRALCAQGLGEPGGSRGGPPGRRRSWCQPRGTKARLPVFGSGAPRYC